MAQVYVSAVPIKMYRHFAVITIMLTATLALFAEGRNPNNPRNTSFTSEAELMTISANRPRPRTAPSSSQPAYGEAQLIVRDEITSGFSDYDSGSEDGFGSENSPSGPQGRLAAQAQGERNIPGYSREYLESLTEEQYQQLLASLDAAGMLDPEERERNIDAMKAASRRRSGHSVSSE